MSFRPELKPYPVFNSTTGTSMATSLTGLVTLVPKLTVISYQFIWSAGSSPVGTIGVQVSNDYTLDDKGNAANTGTWSTYYFLKSDGTIATSKAVSGTTGNEIIELPNISFYAVRPIYTRTSGSGTMSALICGKVM